jgi:hypothetical protein
MFIVTLSNSAADSVIKTNDLPPIDFDEDEEALRVFNLNDYFSGSNHISFRYTAESLRIEVIINDDGYVDLSAPPNWYGSEEVTFIASDGEHEVRDTTTITVNPINDAPEVVSSIPDVEFNEDTTLINAINLHQYFQDVDSDMEFSSSSDNIIIDISSDGSVDFSSQKDWSGCEAVTFFASDESTLEETSISVNIEVHPVNDAPTQLKTITPINLRKEAPDVTINLNDYFEDVDGDSLSYRVIGDNNVDVYINEETDELTFKTHQRWNGRETISIVASDNSGESCNAHVVLVGSWEEGRGPNYIFYLYGLILGSAIISGRLYLFKIKYKPKSPVKLESYSHYKRR